MESMSSRFNITYSSVMVAIIGIALLFVGGLLAYYAISSEWFLGPRILAPMGFVLFLLGLIVLASREG